MFKYMLKESHTDVIDCSTPEERDYINGDTTFSLLGWNAFPRQKYFEKSEATVLLSGLPQRLQNQYTEFVEELIIYIRELPISGIGPQ